MNRRRRAYVLLLFLVACFLVIAFAGILAQLAAFEAARERQAQLAEWGWQLIASARDWSSLHDADFAAGPVTLPVADLLPPHVQGTVTLERVAGTDSAGDFVRCRLTLERGKQRLRREVEWPLLEPPRLLPTRPGE